MYILMQIFVHYLKLVLLYFNVWDPKRTLLSMHLCNRKSVHFIIVHAWFLIFLCMRPGACLEH